MPIKSRMRRAVAVLASSAILFAGLPSGAALAQQYVPPGGLVIDGIPVNCGNVGTVLGGDEIGDVARAIPGQILLNWARFNAYPTAMKMFTYAHECGHQLYGSNENVADEFAVKLGRAQGWLRPWDIQQICQGVWMSPGDWTHLPGPARCQNIVAYYNQP
jgi:hypothetical protein